MVVFGAVLCNRWCAHAWLTLVVLYVVYMWLSCVVLVNSRWCYDLKRKRREMKEGGERVVVWRDNDAGDECYVGVCYCRCVYDEGGGDDYGFW